MTPGDTPTMLVVGGSGSIGSEIVTRAAAAGWAVAMHRADRSDRGHAQRSRRQGERTAWCIHTQDLPPTSPKRARSKDLVQDVGNRYGRIDAVVDCISDCASSASSGVLKIPFPMPILNSLPSPSFTFSVWRHAALPWLRRAGGTLICFAGQMRADLRPPVKP